MSRFRHLSFLVLLASLFTRTRGQTENATEHITIKKQGDGPLVMSSGMGESRYSFTDWQLDVDLIKILEDGVTNRTAECSSSKSDVIEERRKLLRIFCPKEGDKDFKLIPRSVWAEVTAENGSHTSDDEDLFQNYRRGWEEVESTSLRRTKQAELLIVSVDFLLVSNFFIENDGRIFEGLGWDNVSYGISGGLGDRALLIVFSGGRDPNPTPSEAAVRAYESLVRYAICTGRLPTDYLLLPYFLIWDRLYSEWWSDTANYESNQMREWNAYADNVDFLFPPGSGVDQELHVVSREEWKRPNSTMYLDRDITIALDHPVSRVVVSSNGPRCFKDCTEYLMWITRTGTDEWFLPFNFIITESGWVYEGFGWNHTLREEVDQKYIRILFLGRFVRYSPRKPAFNALNKIIDEGLRNGKIIPDYQITTANRVGEGLYQYIGKMDRFKPYIG